MFSNYGLLRVSFAGAGTDRGLVLADGIPAQDGFGGQIDWAAYPPETLERAELLLGAGSALYGAGAVGGVLDLETFAPPATPNVLPFGDIEFLAGTHEYTRQTADLRGSVTPHLSAAVVLQQQRLQYADLPPGYQSSIDRESQSNASVASVRLRYRAGERDAIELGTRGAWDDQFEGRRNYTFSRRLAQNDVRYTHSSAHGAVQATAFTRAAYIVNVADQFPAQPGVLRYIQDVPTNEDGFGASWTVSAGSSTFQPAGGCQARARRRCAVRRPGDAAECRQRLAKPAGRCSARDLAQEPVRGNRRIACGQRALLRRTTGDGG